MAGWSNKQGIIQVHVSLVETNMIPDIAKICGVKIKDRRGLNE